MNIDKTIRDLISANVDKLDGNAIPEDAPLIESGLDSLDFATVQLEIQEEFDVTIPEGQEDAFDTIAKLVGLVESAKNA